MKKVVVHSDDDFKNFIKMWIDWDWKWYTIGMVVQVWIMHLLFLIQQDGYYDFFYFIRVSRSKTTAFRSLEDVFVRSIALQISEGWDTWISKKLD